MHFHSARNDLNATGLSCNAYWTHAHNPIMSVPTRRKIIAIDLENGKLGVVEYMATIQPRMCSCVADRVPHGTSLVTNVPVPTCKPVNVKLEE